MQLVAAAALTFKVNYKIMNWKITQFLQRFQQQPFCFNLQLVRIYLSMELENSCLLHLAQGKINSRVRIQLAHDCACHSQIPIIDLASFCAIILPLLLPHIMCSFYDPICNEKSKRCKTTCTILLHILKIYYLYRISSIQIEKV